MTTASCQRRKAVSSPHKFGNCYDFSMFAYMSLIYQNQTSSGIFTRRFWSTANKSIKWTVGECLCDLTHNGNCEWRDAGAILNEVINSVHVIVPFHQTSISDQEGKNNRTNNSKTRAAPYPANIERERKCQRLHSCVEKWW